MSENTEILLNQYQNIRSVNADMYKNIEINNKQSQLIEYNVDNVLSVTEIFDAEREANPIYRIYGRMEYLSLLNGLPLNYTGLSSFFNSQVTNCKNIFNSFNFYLVRPSTGYTKISGGDISSSNGVTLTNDFNNWTTSSPSDYPNGWSVSVTTGSYVQQSLSLATQAKFTIAYTSQDSVTLTKIFSPVFGNFTINTGGSITPYYAYGTDFLLIKVWSNNTLMYTFDVLTETEPDIIYDFTLPESTPLTKITITAISHGKTLYMNYFRLYQNNSNSGEYVRYFEVIATPTDFEIFNAGFSNNVYGNQIYSFNFNIDFDVTTYVDNFGFPPTELFLYARYIPTTNGKYVNETFSGTTWSGNGIAHKTLMISSTINIGDRIYGDVIQYSESEFFQAQVIPQTYYIGTPYVDDNNNTQFLIWNYNPFIPFQLRYFNSTLNQANSGSTSYEQVTSIPYYATSLGNGNYVWRDILQQGLVDPVTNQGVNYPFVNMKRYLFAALLLDVSPDLNNQHTYNVFNEILFASPTSQNTSPITNLNNIGKPC